MRAEFPGLGGPGIDRHRVATRAERRVGARLFALDHDVASLLTGSHPARGKVARPMGPQRSYGLCWVPAADYREERPSVSGWARR